MSNNLSDSKETKQKIKKARSNFVKDNDVKKFYNRIIQAATNTQNSLFPSKVHAVNLSRYQTEDEYEKSMAPAIKFASSVTEKQKKTST